MRSIEYLAGLQRSVNEAFTETHIALEMGYEVDLNGQTSEGPLSRYSRDRDQGV